MNIINYLIKYLLFFTYIDDLNKNVKAYKTDLDNCEKNIENFKKDDNINIEKEINNKYSLIKKINEAENNVNLELSLLVNNIYNENKDNGLTFQQCQRLVDYMHGNYKDDKNLKSSLEEYISEEHKKYERNSISNSKINMEDVRKIFSIIKREY